MCAAQVLWLNTAMKTLWPYYNNAVGKMVLEQVGPALDPILAKVRPLLKPCHLAPCRASRCASHSRAPLH